VRDAQFFSDRDRRGGRVEGSWTFVSPNTRPDSNEEAEEGGTRSRAQVSLRIQGLG